MQPTRIEHFRPTGEFLAVALELSSGSWKIGLHDGKREKPAIRTVSANSAACRLEQAVQQIEKIKSRWGLAPDVRTVVLYEAGQDGFWITLQGPSGPGVGGEHRCAISRTAAPI